MAMYFDESCKKSRCGYGEGTRKAFDVISSYVLQSGLEVPDHSRGKLFRKLSAAFSAAEGCLGTPSFAVGLPTHANDNHQENSPNCHTIPGELISLSPKLSGPSSPRQPLLGRKESHSGSMVTSRRTPLRVFGPNSRIEPLSGLSSTEQMAPTRSVAENYPRRFRRLTTNRHACGRKP